MKRPQYVFRPNLSDPQHRRAWVLLQQVPSAKRKEFLVQSTRTQATYDFLKITHDGTKGEVTVTLPLGKYTITEVQAPYGFVLTQQSYTVEFGWDNQKNDIVLAKTIVSHEQDGDKKCSYSIVNVKDVSDAHKNGQTLVFENARVLPTPEKPGDKVSKIGVGIYKQDREALTYLAGAVYELYTVDDIFSADGTKLLDAGTKLAESSPTNESGFAWFAVDIPIRAETYPDSGNSGRYRIVEVAAPAAYLLDSTPVDVEFTYEGQQIAWQVVDGTNTNLRTTVDISKQDITNGKELPDAKLEIRDADGNLVEGWTSTKTPHTVRGLELEKAYTLTETRAPDGYAEAESIVFKLVQNGTEQVNEVYVKSDDDWVKLDDATVIMQDAPVLDIDKTDIAGNLLPGATLTICDAGGKVIDTWVTDYKTHKQEVNRYGCVPCTKDAKLYHYVQPSSAQQGSFAQGEGAFIFDAVSARRLGLYHARAGIHLQRGGGQRVRHRARVRSGGVYYPPPHPRQERSDARYGVHGFRAATAPGTRSRRSNA